MDETTLNGLYVVGIYGMFAGVGALAKNIFYNRQNRKLNEQSRDIKEEMARQTKINLNELAQERKRDNNALAQLQETLESLKRKPRHTHTRTHLEEITSTLLDYIPNKKKTGPTIKGLAYIPK